MERDDVDAVIEQWDRERPDLDSSPIGIVGRVSRLARELEVLMEPTYREHDPFHETLYQRPRPVM